MKKFLLSVAAVIFITVLIPFIIMELTCPADVTPTTDENIEENTEKKTEESQDPSAFLLLLCP